MKYLHMLQHKRVLQTLYEEKKSDIRAVYGFIPLCDMSRKWHIWEWEKITTGLGLTVALTTKWAEGDLFGIMKNKQVVVIIAQICKFPKNQIVHIWWVNFMICNLYLKTIFKGIFSLSWPFVKLKIWGLI